MSIPFSDSTGNTGIVEQTRSMARVDSTIWPTSRISNSCNNWLDTITGYAIGADRRFQWDDTNQSKLPEGTTTLTAGQSDYSFLTDEQGNPIITLTGVSILQNGKYLPLTLIDRTAPDYDPSTFGLVNGVPSAYDKIADNIIRLDFLPIATVSAGLKFYFQRTGSYFASTDTTKSPGVSPLLHRGFIIASAYDCALTLGLPQLQGFSLEMQKEDLKMQKYFADRNQDDNRTMTMGKILYI